MEEPRDGNKFRVGKLMIYRLPVRMAHIYCCDLEVRTHYLSKYKAVLKNKCF